MWNVFQKGFLQGCYLNSKPDYTISADVKEFILLLPDQVTIPDIEEFLIVGYYIAVVNDDYGSFLHCRSSSGNQTSLSPQMNWKFDCDDETQKP